MSTNDRLPENILCYGAEERLPEQVGLRAGPLNLVFEGGDLRWIRMGDREIVRRIYVAVRDRNWGTVLNRVLNLSILAGPASFEIGYDVENREGPIHFLWSGRITGDEAGTITFSMRGVSQTDFWKNRIGFCVLHPIRECAGRHCTITKEDGTVEQGRFPLLISPHQPFWDFRGISHRVDAKTSVSLTFEGDVFEMEDQRNWTDASFKTYCTPLRLPYPVRVPAGSRVDQTVRLSLNPAGREHAGTAAPRPISLSINPEQRKPLPDLGLGIGMGVPEPSPRQIELLRLLNLSHLRVDLDLGGPYRAVLDSAVRLAGQMNVPLEAALILPTTTSEVTPLLKDLFRLTLPVARWLVFNRAEKCTSAESIRLVRDCLAGFSLRAPRISGTNAYFAELNRVRPELDGLDGICYSINPQVHAFDNDSLVESLAAQRDTVETARQFAGVLPIFVSPVTLRPRFNPNATGPEPVTAPGQLPPQADARQMSLFGMVWTIGSLKYLSEAGVAGVTYYETSGWRGVMERESGSPLPEKFRSIPGGVFPIFHALADAGDFRGGEVLGSQSSAPLAIESLVMSRGDQVRILLANMRCERQRVLVQTGEAIKQATIRALDQTNAEQAMRDPHSFRAESPRTVEIHGGCLEISMGAYGATRLDGVLGGC